MMWFMEHLLLRWFRAGLGVPSLAAKLEEKNLFPRSSGTLLAFRLCFPSQPILVGRIQRQQSVHPAISRFLHVLPPQKFLY
jgi:hypothetical protein